METLKIAIEIVSLIGGLFAIVGIPSILKRVRFKQETLYGDEAESRYNSIKATLPEQNFYGLFEHKGGAINVPKLEVSRVVYDPQTMGPEWKG